MLSRVYAFGGVYPVTVDVMYAMRALIAVDIMDDICSGAVYMVIIYYIS